MLLVFEVDRHYGTSAERVPWRPTLDFKMAAVKPVLALIVALVEISASFQMLEYVLKRLNDAVDERPLYQPTLKIAFSNNNVVDLSTGT